MEARLKRKPKGIWQRGIDGVAPPAGADGRREKKKMLPEWVLPECCFHEVAHSVIFVGIGVKLPNLSFFSSFFFFFSKMKDSAHGASFTPLALGEKSKYIYIYIPQCSLFWMRRTFIVSPIPFGLEVI